MFIVHGWGIGLPKGRDPQGEQNHANTFRKIVLLGEKVTSVFLGSRGDWTRSGRLVNMFKNATQSASLTIVPGYNCVCGRLIESELCGL